MIDPRFHRQPQSSTVTAIPAGVVAFVGGIIILSDLPILLLFDSADIDDPPVFLSKLLELLLLAFGLLLVVGGIRTFRRQKGAHTLLGVGGIGTLAVSVIKIPTCGNGGIPQCEDVTGGHHSVSVTTDLTPVSAIGVVFGITVLVLTFLPSTLRWLADRRTHD
ncbi:hypothetical protein [Nocardia arthritidis]|uniref:Uncharacterized protein n=1 Tax=Nocardia arthritidis TaxID=228602 RepID=A0A6G9YFK6_9NOCA|nr:hypothetical protein [Nocardia arthritidis]QIS11920.1 hypothetical protein F5544_20275 [Nocardia arthritidis]